MLRTNLSEGKKEICDITKALIATSIEKLTEKFLVELHRCHYLWLLSCVVNANQLISMIFMQLSFMLEF